MTLPGFEARFDAASQSMDLKFQPGVFSPTRISPAPELALQLSKSITSLVVNYDINDTLSTSRRAGTGNDLGAIVDLRLSGEFGVLSSSQIVRRLRGAGGKTQFAQRLETTFTRDFPERNISLRLGDTTTRNSMMGRSVYFGGLQLARNFQLSPGLTTQPVPVISGQSSAPSTVELYVNDALRQTSQVPAGPFQIDISQLLAGGGNSGQARVVVRDLLGRETVLVQDLFGHHDLLESGLSDWSIDAGAVRNNLGITSNDYGSRFASTWWRHGVSQTITVETHAEAGKLTRGASAGATVALPAGFSGQIGFAGSHDILAGGGRQWLFSLDHSGFRHGLGFRVETATQTFRQIGVDASAFAARRQLSANYSYFNENRSQFALSYARIESFIRSPITTYSANYSLPLFFSPQRGTMSLGFTQVLGEKRAHALTVNLTLPIDKLTGASAGINQHDRGWDSYLSASQAHNQETGMGWRALAGSTVGGTHVEGGWYYQGSQVALASDVSAYSGQQTLRLGARGGIVVADGSAFATRRIDDSFALVDVAGYADVGVGFQGNALTHTDASGRALVPRLTAFRSNSIRLNPNELPIGAELDSIEQIVTPASRVGVKAVFPVRSGRSALLTIVLDDGEPAPAGAELKIRGDEKEFFVARRGQAFVTGLQPANVLSLDWNGKTCEIAIDLPPGKPDDIARLGPLPCRGVSRQLNVAP
ncbi:MAG: fimbria/pilus outer membrane usher protein [Betaproteobacteria bacterium]